MAHKRLTLTAYETRIIRDVALALVRGETLPVVMGPLRNVIRLKGAQLACRWEREGVAGHFAGSC